MESSYLFFLAYSVPGESHTLKPSALNSKYHVNSEQMETTLIWLLCYFGCLLVMMLLKG